MITLGGYEPPHLSYSQYSTYQRCGKAYELDKVMKAPRRPAWYLVGGSAVHEVTEAYDTLCFLQGESVTVETEKLAHQKLDELIEQEVAKTGIAPEKWMAAGMGSRAQTREYWYANAPLMFQRWIDWRAETKWPWLEINAQPQIEKRLEVTVGGLPLVVIPDRVAAMPDHSVSVVDLKTGSKAPADPLQLGVCATALELSGAPRPKWGIYWMAKTGKHTSPVPLEKYSKEYLDNLFGPALTSIRAGVFLPQPGESCRNCSVAAACYSADGAESHLYDRLNPSFTQTQSVTVEEEVA